MDHNFCIAVAVGPRGAQICCGLLRRFEAQKIATRADHVTELVDDWHMKAHEDSDKSRMGISATLLVISPQTPGPKYTHTALILTIGLARKVKTLIPDR
jgi:hypothetical protein